MRAPSSSQPGLDLGQNQRHESVRDVGQDGLEFPGGEDPRLVGDDLGEFGVRAGVVADDPVAHGA
jgi:hypothetical protein